MSGNSDIIPPPVKTADLATALLALRTLVIATHGPEAWPWAMREERRKRSRAHFCIYGNGRFRCSGAWRPRPGR